LEVTPVDVIQPGTEVVVRTADGESLLRRATSGVEWGSTFEVVWVCKQEEWEAASAEGRYPDAMPWPADAVTLHRETVNA
jgi:hypothetical protein